MRTRRGDRRVRLDRLGLGRLVGREHEGLHALLVQRALPQAAGPGDAVAGCVLERLVRSAQVDGAEPVSADRARRHHPLREVALQLRRRHDRHGQAETLDL